MSVVPQTDLDAIQFCETHLPVWSAAAASIGVTPASVSAFGQLTKDARLAYTNAQNIRAASKAATATLDAKVRLMRASVSDLVRQIKAFAEAQADPSVVYAAAQVPAPLPPSPQPAPGIAENIRVSLEPSGAITLSWTAKDAAASSGAFYNVYRKLPGQSSFTSVGGTPGSTRESRTISFTDGTVPTSAAANGAQYIIRGQRGTDTGEPSDAVVVQFGTDTPSGESFKVSFAPSAGAKLAA